jgi:hypothetical protein
MTTIETLRQVVIDEARKVAELCEYHETWTTQRDDELVLAVRALERHEARIEQEAAK